MKHKEIKGNNFPRLERGGERRKRVVCRLLKRMDLLHLLKNKKMAACNAPRYTYIYSQFVVNYTAGTSAFHPPLPCFLCSSLEKALQLGVEWFTGKDVKVLDFSFWEYF